MSGAAPAPGMRGYLDGPGLFSPHIAHWIDTTQVRRLLRCCLQVPSSTAAASSHRRACTTDMMM
jgi:hypothetical protein